MYEVTANGESITAAIAGRLISLEVVDEAGIRSDSLRIELVDPDQAIALPRKGAVLEVSLGDGELVEMGRFVVDEVETVEGEVDRITITGKAAPVRSGDGGQTALQSMRSRSWPAGTSIADMVSTVANEHGLRSSVHAVFAAVELAHVDQVDESDANLLTRMTRDLDAVCTVVDDTVVVVPRAGGESATGRALTPVTITPADATRATVRFTSRWDAGTVVATYNDVDAGELVEIEVGTGEPVRRLRHPFADESTARAAAAASLSRGRRGSATLSVSGPGNPLVRAETPITMSGWRDSTNGTWACTRATHSVRGDGYTMTIEAETP